MSAQGFYRFAAADTASDDFRPKAISYVMAGGLASAIIGPQIVKLSADAMTVPFLGTYLAVILTNVIGSALFLFINIPKPTPPHADAHQGRSRWELMTTPVIAVAVICAMVSYALMNLVMTSAPLAVVGCGFRTADAANVVSAHVLAMYVPSFFTGHLISRFGVKTIMAAGLAILAAAGAVALRTIVPILWLQYLNSGLCLHRLLHLASIMSNDVNRSICSGAPLSFQYSFTSIPHNPTNYESY
jgi:MFS family permease